MFVFLPNIILVKTSKATQARSRLPDYVGTEYGISEREIPQLAANLEAKGKMAIEARKARSFNGDVEASIGD